MSIGWICWQKSINIISGNPWVMFPKKLGWLTQDWDVWWAFGIFSSISRSAAWRFDVSQTSLVIFEKQINCHQDHLWSSHRDSADDPRALLIRLNMSQREERVHRWWLKLLFGKVLAENWKNSSPVWNISGKLLVGTWRNYWEFIGNYWSLFGGIIGYL